MAAINPMYFDMGKIKVILIIFLTYLLSETQGQSTTLRLNLNFHNGFGPFNYGYFDVKWADSSDAMSNPHQLLRNIPTNISQIKKGVILFEPYQFAYQNYMAGHISDSVFRELQNGFGWKPDKKKLSNKKIQCYVNIICGKDDMGKTVCLIDKNNNLDFKDDALFFPVNANSPEDSLLKNILVIDYQRFYNGKIVMDLAPIIVVKNNNNIQFSMAQYATTTFYEGNKRIKLAVCPLLFYSRSYVNSEIVQLVDSLKNKKIDPDLTTKKNDILRIGQSLYKHLGVNVQRKELLLEKLREKDYYSPQVGFYAPLFIGKDIVTTTQISLNDYKGKYIFLEFWGTWCGPCKAELPFLKEAFSKLNSEKIAMLGIATNDDFSTLRNFIGSENIQWPQLLSDKIASLYKINTYPSNFLIDPFGKIIARNIRGKNLITQLNSIINH